MTLLRHDFPDRGALAVALAAEVAARLANALSARGRASIAVSGGATPKAFFRALAERDIDWRRVGITLVDERWVGENSERSNARMVRENLLAGAAAAAVFWPLYRDATSLDAAIPGLESDLADIWPFDVAALGMGTDGHTASFFPGGDNLAAALDPQSTRRLCSMQAPGAGEPRITWTLAALLHAGSIFLHIEGAGKAETLRRAMQEESADEMPVRALLCQDKRPVDIYWAP